MTASTVNIDALIKEARRSQPETRWLVYDRLARDYGDGFAKVVQLRVEESERAHSKRNPRSKRAARTNSTGSKQGEA